MSLCPPEIFKTYDIRGIVGQSLNEDIAYAIGRGFGSTAVEQDMPVVVVGRDGRLSGPALTGALSRGLADSGCTVMDIGMAPTPVTYFATHHLGTRTGISVTGSHNPPDYNGFKLVLADHTLSGDDIQKLRQRIEEKNFTDKQGRILHADVRDAYIGRIGSDIRLDRPLKIAIDCGNGIAGDWAPVLYQALGCDVTEMYCEVDGRFPNHHPDPSQPRNLAGLIETVTQGDFDLGLAFDGDGDRLGVVTGDGKIIWPDRQMILFARDVLARHPGADIIYDIKCSTLLDQAIREAGGKPLMWQTGHSLIKGKMQQTGALLAGEMSGHIFFKERWYGFDDGLYAGARLLEILSKDRRKPADVFQAIPDTVNTPELQIPFAEGEHYEVIEQLRAAADFNDGRVTTIDGIRVDFDDGWGLVRASNTTPVLVLRFEGRDKASLERIQGRFRELLHKARPGLSLPF